MIFVFGSNTKGIHGAGAAKVALEQHGAVWREGHGHHGNSYALPTKDHNIKTLPFHIIEMAVQNFIGYANDNPDLQFKVTRVGCGLAGLKDHQMAPLFKGAPSNCYFDNAWSPYLGAQHNYWGTI